MAVDRIGQVQGSIEDEQVAGIAKDTADNLSRLLAQKQKAGQESALMQQKIAAAQNLAEQRPGQGVNVEGVGIQPGMTGYRNMQMDAKALQGASSVYNKALPKMHDQLNTYNELFTMVNDPTNPLTAGELKTLLIRANGVNRYNQQEANAFIQNTAQQYGAKAANFFGLPDTAQVPNNVLQGVRDIAKDQFQNLKDQHGSLVDQAQNAYMMHPGANPETAGKLRGIGDAFNNRLSQTEKSFLTPENQQAQKMGIGDMLVRSLTGNKQAKPQASPTPTAGTGVQPHPDQVKMLFDELKRMEAIRPPDWGKK